MFYYTQGGAKINMLAFKIHKVKLKIGSVYFRRLHS